MHTGHSRQISYKSNFTSRLLPLDVPYVMDFNASMYTSYWESCMLALMNTLLIDCQPHLGHQGPPFCQPSYRVYDHTPVPCFGGKRTQRQYIITLK